MNKKELPNNWKPDLKPKTDKEISILELEKEIMHIENKLRFMDWNKNPATFEQEKGKILGLKIAIEIINNQ